MGAQLGLAQGIELPLQCGGGVVQRGGQLVQFLASAGTSPLCAGTAGQPPREPRQALQRLQTQDQEGVHHRHRHQADHQAGHQRFKVQSPNHRQLAVLAVAQRQRAVAGARSDGNPDPKGVHRTQPQALGVALTWPRGAKAGGDLVPCNRPVGRHRQRDQRLAAAVEGIDAQHARKPGQFVHGMFGGVGVGVLQRQLCRPGRCIGQRQGALAD